MKDQDDAVLCKREWNDLLDEVTWFDVKRRKGRDRLQNNFYVLLLKDDNEIWDRDDWDEALSA